MEQDKNSSSDNKRSVKYLTALGAWALSFGCAVGWGSFVMPGNTFLPVAGPIGTAAGIALGALVMVLLAKNYHYLMNRYPGAGGAYTYTQKAFGFDHGFINAWFLLLTYVAIIWANASALPLIARTLLGNTFRIGFHYTIAGYDVYMGEILLSCGAIATGALLCLRRKLAEMTQIVMAVLLFGGIVLCFTLVMGRTPEGLAVFSPACSTEHSAAEGIFTIFSLAPWAFVGFESISHSAGEAAFDLKRSFRIMIAAIVMAALAYILLALLSVTTVPEGYPYSSWTDYIRHLSDHRGVESQPSFFAAYSKLGNTGSLLLGTAALCGIFTGIIGNYIALSRLLKSMSTDGLINSMDLSELNQDMVPQKAILIIMGVSFMIPFFGRTAISWIVDVTTVGAIIVYAFTSASAIREARIEDNSSMKLFGMAGVLISVLFALEFLVPNLISVKTLSTESYLILAAWSIIGFLHYRHILMNDTVREFGRSVIAWVVLLGLIIFTSSVWMLQTTETTIESGMYTVHEEYMHQLGENGVRIGDITGTSSDETIINTMKKIDDTLPHAIVVQMLLIIGALVILFSINSMIQKRERQVEVEKALAEESSRAKTSFLSNMSHEIRTPMNAIIGLDNIALRNPDLQPQTREQLEKIGASAKHLLGLINDILDMSRIESGRMVLKAEEFSFSEFLEQINIIISGQCQDKGLTYDCRINGNVADYYYGDDMKLKQVLINILGNSVKFTEAPGTVTFTAEETADFEGMRTLRFTMHDTGVGMDKKYIPRIFEAFSQEDATATNHYGGSGLGMAITKNFVDMMNGDISVESEKGVGTTFTVTVTLKVSERSAHKEHGIDLPEGLRAIVVDDDDIACEHGRLVLRSIGIEADAADSGIAALSLIRDAYKSGSPYDFILTDLKMPDMNGLELVRSVREFDNGETGTILLTGYNPEAIRE